MEDFTYIDVAVSLPLYQTYTYSVPEPLRPMIAAGKRVLVPFGNRRITGYVLGPAEIDRIDGIKPVIEILDEIPLFPASMIPLFKWMADYYIHPLGEVIKEALPGGINVNDCVALEITPQGRDRLKTKTAGCPENDILCLLETASCRLSDVNGKLGREVSASVISKMIRDGLLVRKREISNASTRQKTERCVCLNADCVLPPEALSEARQRVFRLVAEHGEIAVSDVKKILPTGPAHLKALEQKGYVSIFSQPVYRDPFGDTVPRDTPPKLTLDQQHVVSGIVNPLGRGFETFLLAGVTGSGKTEVYMHAAAEALKKGLSVLVLVPEIALISEIERRFRARFGECVAVLHSGLSAGERLDQWVRVSNRQCPIVIGARSAIFAPLTGIGLIIVDEEHDTSYKQESRFRYNARDMAVIRARMAEAVVVLGSATPSIQSVYNVGTRKFSELNLQKRVFSQTLPDISVVDLKQRKDDRGTRRFITIDLQQAMKETLDRGEQVLLFLNRRGFASYPVCAQCGEPLKCRHCDITLTLHQAASSYKCHLCGFSLPASAACTACGSRSIKLMGMGTEKIEAAVRGLFPEARVARMDRDTTVRKGALLKILKGLRHQEIDILIGTQMVAKGHDFPNITLVGIICADLSLSFPDFRAGELTFQVLAQVAGRAGRGERPGRVILQTYSPEHFSITAATDQDFMAFYNQEISFRKTFNYPPFSRMIQLKISGADMKKTRHEATAMGGMCDALKRENPDFNQWIEVLGPIEAPLSRIAGRFRWQIILKSPNATLLHQFARRLVFENNLHLSGNAVRVGIDVDPFFMM
ncbi:MAG: primosomal protein N' [Desulfobacteraceae bacterium]|nr:MAG: primosomal protein N' [Desulfobacteraceae bacterium]